MRPYMIVVLAMTLGCYTGPAARQHDLATSGRGAIATIRTPKETLRGELLEVRDTALVVATATHVVIVPRHLVRTVRFRRLEDYYVHKHTDERLIGAFARLSRYPAGAPPGMIDEISRVTNKSVRTQQR